MIKSKIVVQNESGLHAKPVRDFVNLVKTLNAKTKIEIKNNNTEKKVLASSLLNVLTLRVIKGTEITIYCSGEDKEEAQKAMDAIIDFISKLEG